MHNYLPGHSSRESLSSVALQKDLSANWKILIYLVLQQLSSHNCLAKFTLSCWFVWAALPRNNQLPNTISRNKCLVLWSNWPRHNTERHRETIQRDKPVWLMIQRAQFPPNIGKNMHFYFNFFSFFSKNTFISKIQKSVFLGCLHVSNNTERQACVSNSDSSTAMTNFQKYCSKFAFLVLIFFQKTLFFENPKEPFLWRH